MVISELLFLERFDIIDGFTFDYMHATLLGIVKLVTTLIFESTRSVDYNISGAGINYIIGCLNLFIFS